ncbi:hypothetical protein [Paenibacillus sp. S150]|uniref:hypothetical protein n=1 Tax=Paenibacillus sp. S150 TaxID=2749826 RepID=UPI001C56BC4D|nr:hypothetical protein [Paenibacillus sp. S150]MBW4080625.1 hypothetical protein [Paenibacillus sp. S150]
MTTYLFPGQGSQYKGMGEDLFESFREYVKTADDIPGYSLKRLCWKTLSISGRKASAS